MIKYQLGLCNSYSYCCIYCGVYLRWVLLWGARCRKVRRLAYRHWYGKMRRGLLL